MAAVDTLIQILQGNKVGLRESKELEVWFKALGVGTSNLQIKETAGVLEIVSKVKVQDGVAAGEVVTKGQLDSATSAGTAVTDALDGRLDTAEATLSGHLDGGVSKHDGTEIDYERVDGSKVDIQASSDAMEAAINDLDDRKISRAGLVPFAADQSMAGFKLTNLGAPSASHHAARLVDVQNAAAGLDSKFSVRAATEEGVPLPAVTAAGSGLGKTLTANANGILSMDAVSTWFDMDNDGGLNDPFVSPNLQADRVLIKSQVAGQDNCIYAVKDKGSAGTPFILVRSIDADGSPAGEVTANLYVFVSQGTENQDTGWQLLTNDPIVLDTTPLVFTQFSGAGLINSRDAIDKTGNILDVKFDETSLEVAGGVGSGGVGQIKNLGVTLAKLAADSVDENKFKSTALGSELTGGSGTLLNVETLQTALNATGSTILAGRLVYLKNVGGSMEMELADPTITDADDKILGVLVSSTLTANSGTVHVRQGTKVTPSAGGPFIIGKPVYAGTAGAATQTAPVGVKPYRLGRAVTTTLVRLDQELLIPYPGFVNVAETVTGAPKTSFVLTGSVILSASHFVDAWIDGRLQEDGGVHFSKNVGTNSIDFTVAVPIGRRVLIRVYLK